jgi:DnaJ-class molecular chaperone
MKKLLIVLFFTVLFLSACAVDKCQRCDGKGYTLEIFGKDTVVVSCPACNGTGEKK